MKKIFIFLALNIFGFSCFSQQKSSSNHIKNVSSTKTVWIKGAQFFAIAGQAGSKNWASGNDVFSVSANMFLTAHANLEKKRWYFNNSLFASYGLINTDEYATIKNDDKIDLFSTLGIKLRKKTEFGIGAALNFRSQFSNGYDRDYLNQGIKRRTSGFFAPAYITAAPIGINYQTKNLSIYGTLVGFRGVIVSNEPYSYHYQGAIIPGNLINEKNLATVERSVAEMYGVNPKKTIQYQVGPYISAAYNKEIYHNISYMGRIDLFSDFTHSAPENVDIFFMNTFVFKINNWLNALYSLDLAYDDDIKKFGYYKDHPALQSKSILGIGINARFGKDRIKTHKSKHNKISETHK
ncbi:MAG: DUF3078 domain-containing protein [Ginsengibacter sp.]